MLLRLPIALRQEKSRNNLYKSKEITKKEYNDIIKSIQLRSIMKIDTVFMKSKNSQSSKPHVFLVLKFTDKLPRGEKRIALSNLITYYAWKNIKSSFNNNKFEISAPTWNDKFELPDASYPAPGIQGYFEYILKEHSENIDNPSVKIYVNKIEHRIIFRIKKEYILEFLTPETMKLLGSTENKITKEKNGENVPHLKIAEVVLVHCNIANNSYQQGSRVL